MAKGSKRQQRDDAADLAKLIGVWESDPDDLWWQRRSFRWTMRFTKNGFWRLTVQHKDGQRKELDPFRVQKGILLTLASGNELDIVSDTPFEFTADDKLILYFGGQHAVFRRKGKSM